MCVNKINVCTQPGYPGTVLEIQTLLIPVAVETTCMDKAIQINHVVHSHMFAQRRHSHLDGIQQLFHL